MVLNKTSPFVSGRIVVPLFHLTIFFAVSSTFALISTLLAAAFSPRHSVGAVANIAIRQGIILALVFTSGLVFQQFRVLTWWAAILLLTLGLLIELSLFDRE